jgi:hypothetical protein
MANFQHGEYWVGEGGGKGGALISAALLAQTIRHTVASGYTAAGLIHVYQLNVSFLSFHLSLCRGELYSSR